MVFWIFRRDFPHGVAIGDQARSLRRALVVAVQRADRREIRPFTLRLCAHSLAAFRALPPCLQLALVFHSRRERITPIAESDSQYAIPQVVSCPSAALNPSMARLNWKECSSATARLNSFCATSLHDVAKCTDPNFSPFPC